MATINGIVTIGDTEIPGQADVLLLNAAGTEVVASTTSDPVSGAYSFDGLPSGATFRVLVLGGGVYRSRAFGPVVTEPEGDGDPYWSNVICSMPLNSNMHDLKGHPVTVVGGCAIDSADGAAGNGCLVAPAGAYLELDLDANLGDGDFTVEAFVRPTAAVIAYAGFLSIGAVAGQDFSNLTITRGGSSGTRNHLAWISWGSGWSVSGYDLGLASTEWAFVTVQRRGAIIEMFRDGVKTGKVTGPASFPQKGPTMFVGKKSNELHGNYEMRLQHLRITKGVARYTEDFDPPTAPFPNS